LRLCNHLFRADFGRFHFPFPSYAFSFGWMISHTNFEWECIAFLIHLRSFLRQDSGVFFFNRNTINKQDSKWFLFVLAFFGKQLQLSFIRISWTEYWKVEHSLLVPSSFGMKRMPALRYDAGIRRQNTERTALWGTFGLCRLFGTNIFEYIFGVHLFWTTLPVTWSRLHILV
jgi:hypothetical protein